MFKHFQQSKANARAGNSHSENDSSAFYSRGLLPADCGDVGCIAVNSDKIAVSMLDGEVMIMAPA